MREDETDSRVPTRRFVPQGGEFDSPTRPAYNGRLSSQARSQQLFIRPGFAMLNRRGLISTPEE